mgnify:FL=1
MGKELQPRKHRHKRHYTFMIISGDSDRKNKQIHLGHVATQVLAFSLFAILVAIVCYIAFITLRYKNLEKSSSATLASMQKLIANQNLQIDDLSSINSSLQTENQELMANYEQVSKALNIMVDDEEAQEAAAVEEALPKGFPISSQATYESRLDDPSSDSKDNASEGDYILVFTVSSGSQIVASGTGTVLTITSDSKYGKCITIDHGNGYKSIYRFSGTVLVEEGDTVSRGTALFLAGDKSAVLGYQIQYNDEFVNPEDIIEING